MQKRIRNLDMKTCWFARLTLALLLLAPLAGMSADDAADQGPPQEQFLPKSPKGPIVIVISGQSGTPNYRKYSSQVAELGYYTVLIDGKDILTRQQDGAANLRKVIAKAQTSPNAVPGKVAVVAFSQGGGGVLAHATSMPDLITMAVVHYPATTATLPGTAFGEVCALAMTLRRLAAPSCCRVRMSLPSMRTV